MTFAEQIARDELAEQRAELNRVMNPTAHIAHWTTRERVIEEVNERITSLEHKLADPAALSEWWDSIPADTRLQLLNA